MGRRPPKSIAVPRWREEKGKHILQGFLTSLPQIKHLKETVNIQDRPWEWVWAAEGKAAFTGVKKRSEKEKQD